MSDVLDGAMRGTVAAMAMTGMRVLTVSLGLVKEPPPQQVFRRRATGVMRFAPRKKRRAVIELFHWGVGAVSGAAYGALPDKVRRQPWTGPLYGMVVWTGFQAAAPMLGLPHAKSPRLLERAATVGDHVLYGFVLSDTKRVPTY